MKSKNWLVFKLSALALIAVTLVSVFFLYRFDSFTFWIMLASGALISLLFVTELIFAQSNIHRFIAQMDSDINFTERETLYNFPAPTIIADEDGKIIWYNKSFSEEIYTSDDAFGIHLSKILKIDLDKINSKNEVIAEYNGRHYRISSSTTEKSGTNLSMLYFDDVTDYVNLQNLYKNSRPTVVLIMVDNYEDLLQNVKESEKAHVLVEIEKVLEDFVENSAGILRKLSTDRFLAVVEEQYLDKMIEDRFKILDRARAITISDKMSVTLSIGVGKNGSSIVESEQLAKQALDMALGRGGDQAAVKTESGFEFFGGVSKGIEKQAKVKTRIIATALTEIIESSEKIYIMGHRFGDLDSIGSATGLGGAIHNMGKHVKVVVDPEKNLGKTLIDRVDELENFRLYITPQEAIADITDQTLLIIVDTHNQDIVESKELYQKAKHVVVIDHHRKTVNYIDNAVIFHHEPYASSASEMVSELIQYFPNSGKLPSFYAEALLSGIMLDTKSFVMRTGVRTFEAAAYLRKMGADTVAVRGLFANSIDSYQRRTRIVSAAEIYGRCAISNCDFESEDIRIVAPQAADELLSISGVDAAFVLYSGNNSVNISARSMGAMNVQIVMEKLGGGGHQTMAGTQIPDVTMEEARSMLTDAIDEHIKETS